MNLQKLLDIKIMNRLRCILLLAFLGLFSYTLAEFSSAQFSENVVPMGIDLNDCLTPLQFENKNHNSFSCMNHTPHYVFIKSVELCCRRQPHRRNRTQIPTGESNETESITSTKAKQIPVVPKTSKILYCTPPRYRRGGRRACPRSHPFNEELALCCGNTPIKSLLPYTTATTSNKKKVEPEKKTTQTHTTRPPSPPPEVTECVDLSFGGKPSDCAANAKQCNNSVWFDLMTEQCAKTCNRCNQKHKSPHKSAYGQDLNNPHRRGYSAFAAKSTTVSLCTDGVGLEGQSECPTFESRCRQALWESFMSGECPRTCKACDTYLM